jgi:hypothetical protein
MDHQSKTLALTPLHWLQLVKPTQGRKHLPALKSRHVGIMGTSLQIYKYLSLAKQ